MQAHTLKTTWSREATLQPGFLLEVLPLSGMAFKEKSS